MQTLYPPPLYDILIHSKNTQRRNIMQIAVDISLILGNLITVIFDYQILRKPLKILSL